MSIKDDVKEKFLKYREYKQRLKIIEQNQKEIATSNMGVSYDGVVTGKTNAFHSDTENKVVELTDEDTAEEYAEKKNFCEIVELALDGLTPPEKFIIEEKFYLGGREYYKCYPPGRRPDVEIYTQDEFPYQKNKYHEIKVVAYSRLYNLMKNI